MKKSSISVTLIFIFLLVAALYFIFTDFYLFSEYRDIQEAYDKLENFHTQETKEKKPEFAKGIKTISVKGGFFPPSDEKCITCHIGMKLPYFSPTRLDYDINGEVCRDNKGLPLVVANHSYIFDQIDRKIAKLKKEKADNSKEISELESLKSITFKGKEVSLRKVLTAHPLIGGEERPFQLHPIEEYGCTSCHGGDGSSVLLNVAHGATFDGTYQKASDALPLSPFIEMDKKNDPSFSKLYNFKPAFETTQPLFIGPLMEAKCVQCHESSQANLNHMADCINQITSRKEVQVELLEHSLKNNQLAIRSLLKIIESLEVLGCQKTYDCLLQATQNPDNTPQEISHFKEQLKYMKAFHENLTGRGISNKEQPSYMINKLTLELQEILGSKELASELIEETKGKKNKSELIENFLNAHQAEVSAQNYFGKQTSKNQIQKTLSEFDRPRDMLNFLASQKDVVKNMSFAIESLLKHYKNGFNLYTTQSCYACHRLDGYSRGGFAPDLTKIGQQPLWYVKQSIMWPQGKLNSSTMPTFCFDAKVAQDLMVFLMGQCGKKEFQSPVLAEIELKDWEEGKKLPFEKPISPIEMTNLDYGKLVFATEGCASCHKLQGFNGNINISNEDLDWFEELLPEEMSGEALVEVIETNQKELKEKILQSEDKNSLLQTIEQHYPNLLESFYSNFAFARRAKNQELKGDDLKKWKDLTNRLLFAYIQVYGLGRDIGPHLNWSGIYRSTEWLMGHFEEPAAFIPRSIMPRFPFDETKFYCLTLMLQEVAKQNRANAKKRWQENGFNPKEAYELYCAACHGFARNGNGPVSKMLYPVPKNLRNTTFLLNLTKDRAISSITHGVDGTPMPPWGETYLKGEESVLSSKEIGMLVDWLYQSLPDSSLTQASIFIPKWQYDCLDSIKEMQQAGIYLQTLPNGNSKATERNQSLEEVVKQYFRKETPKEGPEKEWFFIKRKYYTPHNLQQGQNLFEANCATCHGAGATGFGPRANIMQEAKPRMLTNLAWIESRDDLRLLRSIKYGVSGTSMTPWGDQTNVVQRMQLVMYIRSLSQEKKIRQELSNLIFTVFTQSILNVQEGRVNEYIALDEAQKEYLASFKENLNEEEDPQQAGIEYAQEIENKKRLIALRKLDEMLVDLTEEIRKEGQHYQTCVNNLIQQKMDSELAISIFNILKVHGTLFINENGKIVCLDDEEKEVAIAKAAKEFHDKVDSLVKSDEEEIAALQKMEQSSYVVKALEDLKQHCRNLKEIQKSMYGDASITKRSREKQCKLWKAFQEQEDLILENKKRMSHE